MQRVDASKEYDRLKHEGLLNRDLKPMPHGELIAIPVTSGDLELDFQSVVKQPSRCTENDSNRPAKKVGETRDVVIFQQGTDTSVGLWLKLLKR